MKFKSIVMTATCVVLVSCSAFSPPVTPTLLPTLTSTPTPTLLLIETLSPTLTLAPTVTPDILADIMPEEIPTSEPVQIWKGIPIMPGAISGGDYDKANVYIAQEGYVFTVQATTEQLKTYYYRELKKLGWKPSIGAWIDKTDAFLVSYYLDGKTATIWMIPYEDFMLVIIVKGSFQI